MTYAKVAGIPYPYFMAAQAGLIAILIAVHFYIGSADKPQGTKESETPAANRLTDREWMKKFGPVDINTATKRELERVNGIGPAKAKIIIENRPHQSVEDLSGLKGIYPRDLEKWEGQIICKPIQSP